MDGAKRQEAILHLVDALGAEHDLQYAYLFGSFARPGPFRDVDVAVCYAVPERDEADRLAFELQGRLETRLGLPVDVVALNGRPVSFRFHVFRGQPLFVRDDEALSRELERVARDYFDQERRLREATVEAFAQ
jgi:predicted nucleotidyltransferase